ncbi:hypothetical protein BTVI_46736 [Pitangus sulphuratus]|nr:hypothetical protein BTVI_46736 [Pitangus sulphuratus]
MTETGAHTTNSEITIAPVTKKMWIREDAGPTSLVPRLRRVIEEEEEGAKGPRIPLRREFIPSEYRLGDGRLSEILIPGSGGLFRHCAQSPSPQSRKPSPRRTQSLPLPPQHRNPSPLHARSPPPCERGRERVETVPPRYVKREVEMDRRDLHPEAGVVQRLEVLGSMTPAELRDLRKDYSRLPGEWILTWLVQCWDNGARSHMLEGHKAQQLGSLDGDHEIEQGIAREPYNHSLWFWILNAMRERYPFKEYLMSSPGKWMIAEEGVQYLRELAMFELIYCNPDYYDILDPTNLPCTNPMWRKVIKGAPAPCVNCLISVFHPRKDEPDVETMCQWIWSIAENLGDLSDVQHQPIRSRERMERDHEYSRFEDDYEDRDDRDY